MSSNLIQLSIFESSLTEVEGTKCDLAVFGQDFAINNEYHYLNRPVIQLSNNGSAVAHDAFKKSNCIILLLSEAVSLPEMILLAGKLQYLKPVGVLYEVENEWLNLTEVVEHRNLPFPIIFLFDKGKCASSE